MLNCGARKLCMGLARATQNTAQLHPSVYCAWFGSGWTGPWPPGSTPSRDPVIVSLLVTSHRYCWSAVKGLGLDWLGCLDWVTVFSEALCIFFKWHLQDPNSTFYWDTNKLYTYHHRFAWLCASKEIEKWHNCYSLIILTSLTLIWNWVCNQIHDLSLTFCVVFEQLLI